MQNKQIALLISVITLSICIGVLVKSISAGEPWRIILSSISVVAFATLTFLSYRNLKK